MQIVWYIFYFQGFRREELFVTSKLWNTDHGEKNVRPAFIKTLKDLQLDYLDLYLIHWPMALKHGGDPFAKDELGNFQYVDVPYTETWKEMEKAVDDGLVKSIGKDLSLKPPELGLSK